MPIKSRISSLVSRFKPPPPDKLSVRTTFQRFLNQNISTEFSLLPGMGKYILPYRGTWIQVERSRDTGLGGHGLVPWETLNLTTLSMDRDLFPMLIQEARDEALRELDGKMLIYSR
jgi:chaperone BCS1